MILLLSLAVGPIEGFADTAGSGVLLHQGDKLWVLRQPWSELNDWCEWGGGSRAQKVYDVYVYYDSPHEQRLAHMGSTYTSLVRNTIVPAIHRACGSDRAITDLSVSMYRKASSLGPNGLVNDLSGSKTPVWDVLSFSVDGKNVVPKNHQPKEALYHMTPEQVSALDPRAELEQKPADVKTQFTDYSLYTGPGFTITSAYDRAGSAWCEHVYVTGLIEHAGPVETLDSSFDPDYESFLEKEIVPAIQSVCPTFPGSNDAFVQTIRLEFKRTDESRVSGFMGFAVNDDGTVAWRDGRKPANLRVRSVPVLPAAPTAKDTSKVDVAALTAQVRVQLEQSLSGFQRFLSDTNDMVALAKSSGEKSVGAFLDTGIEEFLHAQEHYAKAQKLFDSAVVLYQRAGVEYREAQRLIKKRPSSFAILSEANQLIVQGAQTEKLAVVEMDLGLDTLGQGQASFASGVEKHDAK